MGEQQEDAMANRLSLTIGACAGLAWAAAAQAMPYDVPAGPGPGDPLYVAAETPLEAMPPQTGLAYARAIQEELAAHGYAPGPVDGVIGPQTQRAIGAYQRDAGLPVTGNASKELLDHLKFALPKVTARRDAPRAAGPSHALVTDVQRRLYERGYYTAEIDGLAGPMTRAAVRRFQSDAGLPVTGVIDERLKSELELAATDIRAR
jgi:peptidoglycan hydrolase-like protein with peptidoglycan-binding domain